MAYDEQLANRIRQAFGTRNDITERKMFGGLAFLCRGRMCCGIHPASAQPPRSGRGSLAVSGTSVACSGPNVRPPLRYDAGFEQIWTKVPESTGVQRPRVLQMRAVNRPVPSSAAPR